MRDRRALGPPASEAMAAQRSGMLQFSEQLWIAIDGVGKVRGLAFCAELVRRDERPRGSLIAPTSDPRDWKPAHEMLY